jgi:hypothetical protein
MTSVGYLRWFFNYQREEIQLLLEARGIKISTGEISKLSEEIRCVLRVSREFSGKEQNNLPTNSAKLKRNTIKAMMKIREEGRKIGGDLGKVSEKIYENCQSHMDELFVEVVNNEGEILDVVRHNALEELNHRWS